VYYVNVYHYCITATTATTSFHGTSVSLFQHPTKDDKGEEREPLTFGREKVKTVPEQNSLTPSPISVLPSLPRISLLIQRVM